MFLNFLLPIPKAFQPIVPYTYPTAKIRQKKVAPLAPTKSNAEKCVRKQGSALQHVLEKRT
jgi:hypothetical protein